MIIGTDVVARSDNSCPTCGHDKNEQWELVENPEDDKWTGPPGCGFSNHFEMALGWGRWKTKVLSWDVNIRKHSGPCRR